MTSSSSASSGSLLSWSLFLFLSTISLEDARLRAGVGGRGAIGILGTTREALPTWALSRAMRFGVFSLKPIPSVV